MISDKLHDNCITNCFILSEGEIRIPATSAVKAKCVVNNIFAATNSFRRDLMALLTGMLQLQLSNLGAHSRNQKTTCCKERKKGLHGNTLTYYGMIETQNRGILHIHIIIWTIVLPLLLQKASHIKEICNAASDLLNSQFKCFLNLHKHLEYMILKYLRTKNYSIGIDNNFNPPAMCYLTSHENACALCTHVTKNKIFIRIILLVIRDQKVCVVAE